MSTLIEIPVLDEHGRFPDAYAPLSVGVDAGRAETAAGEAETARAGAVAAREAIPDDVALALAAEVIAQVDPKVLAALAAQVAAEAARDEAVVQEIDMGEQSGTVTFNQLDTTGKAYVMTLTGDVTFDVAAGLAGFRHSITLDLVEDEVGEHTITILDGATPYGFPITVDPAPGARAVLRGEWGRGVWTWFLGGQKLSVPGGWATV